MQYTYTAKAATGDTSTGVIDAGSNTEARQLLRQQGLFALTLQEGVQQEKGGSKPLGRRRRISKKDIMMFTSQLSIMTQSGLDFAEALENVTDQCKNLALKEVLESTYKEIENGKSISEALGEQEHVFGAAYAASVAAGEASGNIPEVLDRLCELLKNEIRLAGTLKTVLSYPVVLVMITGLVIAALFFVVLPQFGKVFSDMDVPVPILTEILLSISAFVRAKVLWICGSLALAVFGFRKLWKTKWAQNKRDRFLVTAYVVRDAVIPLQTGRTFRLLGTMLQSGIPLLECIRLCRASIKNTYYRILFDELEDSVINGRGLGPVIMKSELLPAGAAQMITTGESSGNLGSIVQTVGEFYEEEGQAKICELAKFLEPIIIVLMGVLVSGVVLAVMLPLLDFSTASH